MANSEAGRISLLLEKAQRCAINENLAKARAYIGKPCNNKASANKEVPLESSYLQSNLSCYNYVRPPVQTESVRISNLIKSTLSCETNPSDADTRFSDYAPTPVIPPCPPTVFSGPVVALSCSILPNTPLTPSRPY